MPIGTGLGSMALAELERLLRIGHFADTTPFAPYALIFTRAL